MNDNYVELASKKFDNPILDLVVAMLPRMACLLKIITRKENGKKPFSSEFEFERRRAELEADINELAELCQSESKDQKKYSEILRRTSSTASDAIQEVKSKGLKDDLEYIKNSLSTAIWVVEEDWK